VDTEPESPFENIESALQFVELLCDAIEETRREIEQASAEQQSERRQQALQLVSYNLAKLALHMGTSRRILNDLRTLRRLFLQERGLKEEEEQGEAAEEIAAPELTDSAEGGGFTD
jgi:hypothetical protein